MAFRKGNSKLGKDIWQWSIPAGWTCPGKSEPCKECYAMDGFFKFTNVRNALSGNYSISKCPDFADWAVKELVRLKAKVCRIHVAGDFYDQEYANKWYEIVKKSQQVRFFVYTRSWRIEEPGNYMRTLLTEMSQLKNLRMWWSVDWDTSKPKYVPKHVRLAYMQTDPLDLPKFKVDLIFRTDSSRKQVLKKYKNALICPVENGVNSNFTCTNCTFCFRDRDEAFLLTKPPLIKNKRISLI